MTTGGEIYGTMIRTMVLGNLADKQPLVGIPMDIIRQSPKRPVCEFDQQDVDVLVLRLVDPKTDNHSAFNKRYAVVKHHGTHWTSIPKLWLKDRGAKAGDQIVVYSHALRPALILKLLPQP